MSDLDILQQMIKPTAQVPVSVSYGKKEVHLVEPQQSGSSVTITGIPDDVIIIKGDAFGSPDTVFNGKKGECKRADFIIIAEKGDKKRIVCIEMKAGRGWSEKEIAQQLTGAQCFVHYCQQIGRKFWREDGFLSGYLFRFVSITHASVNKQRTRIKPSDTVHDSPEQPLKLRCSGRLQFDKLAA